MLCWVSGRVSLCLSVWAGALLCVCAVVSLCALCLWVSVGVCVPVVRCVWCFMAGFALCGAVGAYLGALQVRL